MTRHSPYILPPKPISEDIVVFDLDGTLVDTSYKVQHLSYISLRNFLKLLPAVPGNVSLALSLVRLGFKLIFLTGRNESLREETRYWLTEHQLFGRLFMRSCYILEEKIPEFKAACIRSILKRRPRRLIVFDDSIENLFFILLSSPSVEAFLVNENTDHMRWI